MNGKVNVPGPEPSSTIFCGDLFFILFRIAAARVKWYLNNALSISSGAVILVIVITI
jgi:hypothetical protein